MTVFILSFSAFLAVVILREIPGSEAGGFPLDGCATDKLDVLFLLLDRVDASKRKDADKVCRQFVQDLNDFPSNKVTPRVMSAQVIDRFSALNAQVDVTSWNFYASPRSQAYGLDHQGAKVQLYTNVQDAIQLKVRFAERLFSEMGRVRENSTHVAIVFIDGNRLSFEESRSVPAIVRQQDTDMRIFAVLLRDDYETDKVLLNNTLLAALDFDNVPKHALALAICNKCMEGWFSLSHRPSSETLSCYKLVTAGFSVSWPVGQSNCYQQGGQLAIIESETELNSLRRRMYSQWTRLHTEDDTYPPSPAPWTKIFIGLQKPVGNIANRYKWIISSPKNYRPLVVNNWMPGHPSGGESSGCVLWQFDWSHHDNGSANISSSGSGPSDGWVDVDCRTDAASISLCELFVARVEGNSLLRIAPATNESFMQALNKGNLVTFGDNIVSVSANIANSNFLKLMRQNQSALFPIYDCGLDAGAPRYIAYVYVCDHVDHCSNKRDEVFCLSYSRGEHPTTDMADSATGCDGVFCCSGSCLPLQWVNDGEIDCHVCEYSSGNSFSDENIVLNKYLQMNETCAFICDHGECVNFSQLNDGLRDCGRPEGPLDETLGKLKTADTCRNLLGHSMWAPRCVYVRDRYGAVLGCRDTSHLKTCTDFECPEGYFKCPNTYCIPQHYVLDGIVDCPVGEEEDIDTISRCTGNFACWDSKICLHPDLVCDGHPDCPLQDDEVDCHVTCPEGFRCVSGTVVVSDYDKSIPMNSVCLREESAHYLDMSGVNLSIWQNDFPSMLSKTAFINWSNCAIFSLPEMLSYFSRVVQELDVSYNLMQSLDGREIDPPSLTNIRHLNLSYNRHLTAVRYLFFSFLVTLDISHTPLSNVDVSLLTGLSSLKHLNLRDTLIADFYTQVLPPNFNLQTLDIREVNIGLVHEDFFHGLTISQHLYTDSFEACCPQIRGNNIPLHTCHAPKIAISSCCDLVGLKVQRVLLWVVAVLAVLGNMTVIVYRVIWDRSVLRTGYGLFVTNLGISDFIMGVYLFIIAGAYYYFRGVYVLFDKTWRRSGLCTFAGFLATLSCETSAICILLITLDRFLVMKFPFGQKSISKKTKTICVFLAWLIGFLLALTPIVFQFEIYSSNAMCLGLPLTPERLMKREYSFAVFVALNLCLCLVIAYGQKVIFQAMTKNRMTETALNSSVRRDQDITVAKQLSLVALSNFLCWFPVGLMGLLSLGGHEISNDVYAWTTVIVLPINSAANPLLYTIPALMAKWERFKFKTKNHNQNSA